MTPAMREDNGIRHQVEKTGRKRHIVDHWSIIRPDYLAVIDAWGAWKNRPYLRTGTGPMDYAKFKRFWSKWAADERGKALAGVRIHDLRATCVCDDRMAGLTELEIANRRCMNGDNVRKYSRYIDQKKHSQQAEKRRIGA
jgi:hypothetical protein